MAIQTINIGYLANDGTGDDLREAFIKVNENFAEMSAILENTVTNDVTNIGNGVSLYKSRIGSTFQFRTLVDGHGIALTENGNDITITGDPGIEDLLIITDNGSINIPGGHPLLPIQYGGNIVTSVDMPVNSPPILKISVDGNGLIELDTAPKLSGDLYGNNHSIRDVHKVEANTFEGNLQGTVWGIDVRDIDSLTQSFDFGSVNDDIESLLEFFARTIDVDHGTFYNSQP